MYLNSTGLTLVVCVTVCTPAFAQVNVREYAIPAGHGIVSLGRGSAPHGVTGSMYRAAR